MQQCCCSSFSAVHRHSVEQLACMQKLESCGALQTIRLRFNPFGNAMLRFSDQFGCCRWRRRSQVGHEICDREVGLVSDRRNDR